CAIPMGGKCRNSTSIRLFLAPKSVSPELSPRVAGKTRSGQVGQLLAALGVTLDREVAFQNGRPVFKSCAPMISHHSRTLFLGAWLVALTALTCRAQTPDAQPPRTDSPAPDSAPRHDDRRRGSLEGRGTIGKITSIEGDNFVVARPDGTKVTVKLTDKTELRKDHQPAKRGDFKAGDFVMVRGEENADHTITAESLGGRSAGQGPGAGPRGGTFFGEMGQDFVAGEVKSLDPPKLTLQRPDNVTQTV